MKKKYFYHGNLIIIILFVLLIMPNKAGSQPTATIHWMQGIPQSIYSNPGLKPDARIYIGMPGFSSSYMGVAHNGFRIDDLFPKENGTFVYDEDNMLDKLNDNNYFKFDYQHEILAFGFRYYENQFSFNLTEKTNARIGYSKDFMKLMLKGNDVFREMERPANFDGSGLDATYYRELGFGYSREWMDQLRAGARAKVLFGLGNIHFERADFSLNTHPDTYDLNLHSNLLINTSNPFIIDIDKDEDIIDADFDPADFITNTQNLGFAIDLGGVYDIDERFSVGLSLIDLGFINWNSGVDNIEMEGEFDFEGFDLQKYFDDEEYFDDLGDTMLDSIREIFDPVQTSDSYRTMLPTRILLSGTYNISDIHKAGLSLQGEFFDGNFYPSFTAAYSIQPIPQIGGSISYSLIHQNFANVGLGFHFNLYPLQIYFATDNFIPAMQPHTIQTTSFQVGINLLIDYMHHDTARPLHCW